MMHLACKAYGMSSSYRGAVKRTCAVKAVHWGRVGHHCMIEKKERTLVASHYSVVVLTKI